MPELEPWFVYVARCADGSLYTGIAKDVASRIAAHDAGKGARYTRGRGPLSVCAVRRCPTKGDALRLELAVKRLPRADKDALADVRRFRGFARRVLAPAPTPKAARKSATKEPSQLVKKAVKKPVRVPVKAKGAGTSRTTGTTKRSVR